jgi:hypothetical protein
MVDTDRECLYMVRSDHIAQAYMVNTDRECQVYMVDTDHEHLYGGIRPYRSSVYGRY